MATTGKKYGLIISQKDKPQHVPKKVNIFDEDSDDEGGKSEVNTAIQREAFRAKVKKQTQLEIDKALSEDPSVYEYDQIYDNMQSHKAKTKQEKTSGDAKPKYIQHLLKAAENRKKEDERRTERKVQKEREAEGDEFLDKEAFVTSAYKKKMEEIQLAEEAEKRQAQMEEMLDVTKQKDLGGFYRNLLNETTRDDARDMTDSKTESNIHDERVMKPATESKDGNSESQLSPGKVYQEESKQSRMTRRDRNRSYSNSSDESPTPKSMTASRKRSPSSSRSSSRSRSRSRSREKKRRRPDRISDSRDGDKRRSRSREKKARHRSRSTERSNHRSSDKSRGHQKDRDRSRSRDKVRRRSRSNNRNDYKSRDKQRYRSRSRSQERERQRSRSKERARHRSRSKDRERQRSRSGEPNGQSSRISSREEERQKSSKKNDKKISSLESEDREYRDKLKNVDKDNVLSKQEAIKQKYAKHTTAEGVQDARARYLARKLERAGAVAGNDQ